MRLKQWLGISFIAWVVTACAMGYIFYYWDPFTISTFRESFFYLVLIMHVAALGNLFISLVMYIIGRRGGHSIALAIRQGFLYAILVAFILFLQSRRLFSWWNLSLFIMALALMELLTYFVKHEREN